MSSRPGATPPPPTTATRTRCELTRWLAKQPGREADVEQAWRDAAATGNPYALHGLARWLDEQPGRKADARRVPRLGLDAQGHTA